MKANDKILLASKDPNESYINFASTPDSRVNYFQIPVQSEVQGTTDEQTGNRGGVGLISEGVAFNSGIPSRQSGNTLRGFMSRKPG